ncbi:MAG: chromosomal replication initiator protein DnaA [Acidimicrobiaceae bacterium]|nr:chromosomal replication initiator protein DnaA [Acidimicrobiaceae bacterium]
MTLWRKEIEVSNDPEAERIWTSCAQSIRSQVSDAVWRTTFSGARATAFEERSLTVVVPTSLQKARIERRYFGLLTDAIDETEPDITVRIEIDPDWTETSQRLAPADDDSTEPGADSEAAGSSGESGPDIRLTFEQFVTGTSNRFSHAAALAVAETPAGAYNPLFIHGASGLGKTHLLRAISHYVNNHYPSYKVRYVTSETFLNEFVQAIRNSTQPEFKQVYRSNDVLLVDDIQFMEGKDGLQEEFFHTFNDLLQNGAQIVLSSDRAPDAMPTLEDRLRSRFKSGLITDIQPPDLVTRLAILEKKAEFSAIEIPGDVLSFIAENITDSIRELEGALIKVTAYASITGQRCSYDLANRVLADLIDKTIKAPVTVAKILEATAEVFNFTIEQITGGSRRRPLVDARQIAMYVTRNMTDLSYPEIGRAFGNRDHTTVIHAVRKIEHHMTERKEVFDKVQELQKRVNEIS